MEILGKKGLGNFLKIILQIVFVIGILILIIFPIILRNVYMNINPNILTLHKLHLKLKTLLLFLYYFLVLID